MEEEEVEVQEYEEPKMSWKEMRQLISMVLTLTTCTYGFREVCVSWRQRRQRRGCSAPDEADGLICMGWVQGMGTMAGDITEINLNDPQRTVRVHQERGGLFLLTSLTASG